MKGQGDWERKRKNRFRVYLSQLRLVNYPEGPRVVAATRPCSAPYMYLFYVHFSVCSLS